MQNSEILKKVKELREITGVGFKDCKLAIDECNGDIDLSIDYLRKKGISKANKKMERVAAEGLVAIKEEDNKISIVEINCETDFVAKNAEFMKFLEEISKITLKNKGNLKLIENENIFGEKKVKDYLIDLIAKIGEKITIRRSMFFDNKDSYNFYYIHNQTTQSIGKIGVIVNIKSSIKKDELLDMGKKIAMHIAAMNPLSINLEEFDKKIIDNENKIITEELKNSGKDNAIVDKIAKGKLNKFINDNTLLNQIWIMDSKKKVKDVINDKMTINKFIRFKVGEGL